MSYTKYLKWLGLKADTQTPHFDVRWDDDEVVGYGTVYLKDGQPSHGHFYVWSGSLEKGLDREFTSRGYRPSESTVNSRGNGHLDVVWGSSK